MKATLPFPFTTVWRGQIRAAGLFFPCQDDSAEYLIRQRLLALWEPGIRIYRIDEGYVTLLQEERSIDSSSVSGWPLCRQGRGYASAPLSKKESSTLESEQLALVIGGVLIRRPLADAALVRPGEWLDLSGWQKTDPIRLPVFTISDPLPEPAIETILDMPLRSMDPKELFNTNTVFSRSPSFRFLQKALLVTLFLMMLAGIGYALNFSPTPVRETASSLPATPSSSVGVSDLFWRVVQYLLLSLISFVGILGGLSLALLFFRALCSKTLPTIKNIIIVIRKKIVIRPAVSAQPQTSSAHANPPSASFTSSSLWKKLLRWLTETRPRTDEDKIPTPRRPPPTSERQMYQWFDTILAKQHARYMKRMLDMFHQQDLENALRHAIPLAQMGMGELLQHRPGRINPRNDLSIRLTRHHGGVGYQIGTEFFSYLRTLYQNAFEQLKRRDQIEQAAFVLAELLQDIREAVIFLESKDRLRQAAELAEARSNDPLLAIRLWLRLKENDRVFRIAALHKVYLPAIAMLEQHDQHDDAHMLRRHCAIVFEQSGDYEQAIETLWPLADEDAIVMKRLLDKGTALPDSAGVRVLAMKALQRPQESDEIIDLFRARLEQNGADAPPDPVELARWRHIFVQTLVAKATQENIPDLVRNLFRHTWRFLVQDRQRGNLSIAPKQMRRLLSFCRDNALNADLPSLIMSPPAPHNKPEVKDCFLTIDVQVPEGRHVHDAAPLSNTTFILALGEGGVEIVRMTAQGKKLIRRFSCPANRLVLADNKRRALAVSTRDLFFSVTVLDLDTGQSRAYGAFPQGWFADTYDGRLWLISGEGRLRLLDMQSEKPASLWSIGDLPGSLMMAQRHDALFCFVFQCEDTINNTQRIEVWHYMKNGARLNRRDQYIVDKEWNILCIGFLDNEPAFLRTRDNFETSLLFSRPRYGHSWNDTILDNIDYSHSRISEFQNVERLAVGDISRSYCILGQTTPEHSQVSICTIRTDSRYYPSTICRFPDNTPPHFRIGDTSLLAWNQKGRLIALDLTLPGSDIMFSA